MRIKPSLKVSPIKHIGVSSGNQSWDISRHRMAWLESKNKAAWFEAKKDNTLTQHTYRQERYKWPFPSVEEHGKCIIHGTSYTWNEKTCSLIMTNLIKTTIPSDVAAAAAAATATAIASTAFANPTTSTIISITG